jgi:hypothetical protein
MRIPLIRPQGDERPIAWWEWLIGPLVLPLVYLPFLFLAPVLLVIGLVSIPISAGFQFLQYRREGKLRSRLVLAGRYMSWPELEGKLEAGEGTLIVEHRSPKGPIREWWTKDDVIGCSPVPLPVSWMARSQDQLAPLHDYAKECAAKYCDVDEGTARRTDVPRPASRPLAPRAYKARELAQKYPQAKIVTLLDWGHGPLLFAGDAESVFLHQPDTKPDLITTGAAPDRPLAPHSFLLRNEKGPKRAEWRLEWDDATLTLVDPKGEPAFDTPIKDAYRVVELYDLYSGKIWIPDSGLKFRRNRAAAVELRQTVDAGLAVDPDDRLEKRRQAVRDLRLGAVLGTRKPLRTLLLVRELGGERAAQSLVPLDRPRHPFHAGGLHGHDNPWTGAQLSWPARVAEPAAHRSLVCLFRHEKPCLMNVRGTPAC